MTNSHAYEAGINMRVGGNDGIRSRGEPGRRWRGGVPRGAGISVGNEAGISTVYIGPPSIILTSHSASEKFSDTIHMAV